MNAVKVVSRQVPLFSLRLGRDRIIGRSMLQDLWKRACGSSDVEVGATPIDPTRSSGGFIYTLSGLQDTPNLAAVEQRLRVLIAESMPGSPVVLLRLL